MSPAPRKLDWQEASARLERARGRLQSDRTLPPDDTKRILTERARVLARPAEAAPTPTEVVELLMFSLAGERYAIETAHVLEVIPLRELTLVPGAPAHVLGVVNYRGRILSVLDLRRLFELAGQGVGEGSRIVAVEAEGRRFGIFADAVTGLVRIGAGELAPPPATLPGDGQRFVRGVTAAMVAVLDLPLLARDPGIVVSQEGA